jgi:hypothetical protein
MFRKPISKKLRFEVFEHNSFTCQYCGRSPQTHECVLQVDHIISVKNGGTNDRDNLITSCWDCNIGKGKKTASLPVVPDKEVELQLVQDRLAQVIALNKYQAKINKVKIKVQTEKYKAIDPFIIDFVPELSAKIKTSYDKNVSIVGIDKFIEVLELANNRNFKYVNEYMKFLNGVLKQKRLEITDPQLARYEKEKNFFIHEMVTSYNYVNRGMVEQFIKEIGIANVIVCYDKSYNWTTFKQSIEDCYEELRHIEEKVQEMFINNSL